MEVLAEMASEGGHRELWPGMKMHRQKIVRPTSDESTALVEQRPSGQGIKPMGIYGRQDSHIIFLLMKFPLSMSNYQRSPTWNWSTLDGKTQLFADPLSWRTMPKLS
jgi:hypothetical protein